VLGQDNALIGGFILTGTENKKVIIRGIGPSLSNIGIQGVLANPTLELHNQSGATIASNDNWKSSQATEIRATGIPPSNDLESAIVMALPANNASYTAVLRGKNNTTGIGLLEIYDLDQAAASRLANISTRGFVDTGDQVIIGGFIVGGPNGAGPGEVVVRAIGPSLTKFGVSGALPNPTLKLHNGNGATIAASDNWGDAPNKQAIIDSKLAPSNGLESAILTTLAPGNYTAIVRGKNSTKGIGLVEVYNLQ
jgi:hypothetical protein